LQLVTVKEPAGSKASARGRQRKELRLTQSNLWKQKETTMRLSVFVGIVIALLAGKVLADDDLRPGDQVIATENTEFTFDNKVVGTVGKGTPLVVQEVRGDQIRIRTNRPGWLNASAVVKRDHAIEYFSKVIESNPKSQEDLQVRGMIWLSTEQYDKAIADFTASIEIKPTVAAYNERGYCWGVKGDIRRAIADFDAAIELAPRNPSLFVNRGLTYEKVGELDKALSDFDAVLKLDPKNLQALQHRGAIELRSRNYEKAIQDFTAAIEVDPKCVDCFVNRGHTWLESGSADKASADYSSALNLDGTSLAALLNRGISRQILGQLDLALADYNRVLMHRPQLSIALQRRGQIFFNLRQLAASLGDYNAALQSQPGDVRILRDRAKTLMGFKRYPEAIADLTQVLEKNPQDATALKDRATCLQDSGKLKEALDDFTALIDRGVNERMTSFCYYRRGTIWSALEEHEKAISDYSKALERIRDAGALYNRGVAYETTGKVKQAVQDWRAAIDVDPKFALAYNALAWALATSPEASIRDGAAAVSYARQACELANWRDAGYIDTLAVAYAEAGDFPSAVKSMKQALELMEPERANRARARLELFESGKPYHQTEN
jgi:tetratricopeptide (TPR) repeat protein